MVKMPVRIDEVFDWVRANLREDQADLLACIAHPCIYNYFSVSAGEYGDVSAGSRQNTDVSAQLLDSDTSRRDTLPRCWDKAFVLGEQMARSQKCYAGCTGRRKQATP